MAAPAKPAPIAAATTTRKGTNWPTLYITAGCPANRSFSVSASFVAANVDRLVLQRWHLSATDLIVSPHTGQGLVSASMVAPPTRAVRGKSAPTSGASASRTALGHCAAPAAYFLVALAGACGGGFLTTFSHSFAMPSMVALFSS